MIADNALDIPQAIIQGYGDVSLRKDRTQKSHLSEDHLTENSVIDILKEM